MCSQLPLYIYPKKKKNKIKTPDRKNSGKGRPGPLPSAPHQLFHFSLVFCCIYFWSIHFIFLLHAKLRKKTVEAENKMIFPPHLFSKGGGSGIFLFWSVIKMGRYLIYYIEKEVPNVALVPQKTANGALRTWVSAAKDDEERGRTNTRTHQ